jgi:hypothetical protein
MRGFDSPRDHWQNTGMTVHSFYDRPPTPDERMGMKWWNALSKSERGDCLSTAESVAQAWAMFKRGDRRANQ